MRLNAVNLTLLQLNAVKLAALELNAVLLDAVFVNFLDLYRAGQELNLQGTRK